MPKWISPGCYGTVSLIGVLVATGAFSGPAAGTFFASLASISNDLSKVASTGANATMAVSDLAIQVSRSSVSMAKEMWSGIDIEQARADLHGAKWVMHRSIEPTAFLSSPIGQELCPLPEGALDSVALAIQSASQQLPIVAKVKTHFNVSGPLRELSYRVAWLNPYYVAVQVLLVDVSFRLSWAFPVWNALDYDPSSQLLEVSSRISESLRNVQHTRWITNESVEEFSEVFRPSGPQQLWFAALQLLRAY